MLVACFWDIYINCLCLRCVCDPHFLYLMGIYTDKMHSLIILQENKLIYNSLVRIKADSNIFLCDDFFYQGDRDLNNLFILKGNSLKSEKV